MLDMVRSFVVEEDGAVTVDWVVITAAICGFGVAVTLLLRDVTTDEATSVGTALERLDIRTTF
ncbi:MAG: hypothetical protein AAF871_04645 [Pseudomonadota bacterium]